jgi:hypothetical protein
MKTRKRIINAVCVKILFGNSNGSTGSMELNLREKKMLWVRS